MVVSICNDSNSPPFFIPFFTIPFQVFVAAITKRKQICPSNSGMLHGSQLPEHALASSNVRNLLHTEKFRWDTDLKACLY